MFRELLALMIIVFVLWLVFDVPDSPVYQKHGYRGVISNVWYGTDATVDAVTKAGVAR